MTKQIIAMIAAVSRNSVIGNKGGIPWLEGEGRKKFEADQVTFRGLTMGHPVIMGRETFEGVLRDNQFRPLEGRTNIVLTRGTDYSSNDRDKVIIVHNMDEAIVAARASPGGGKLFIAGGQRAYEEGMHRANVLYITEIEGVYEGDRFFPAIHDDEWDETIRKPKEGYTFVKYERIFLN